MPRKKSNQRTKPPQTLRARAEAMLRTTGTDIEAMAPEDVQRLVQELQIHQVELELQNEELREAQIALAESRDRYSDLYDFAPVGYLTLDHNGKILEANLTAAKMLGVERARLVGTKISKFVARDFQDQWFLHRQAVFSGETRHTCELNMLRADGTERVIRLESVAHPEPEAAAAEDGSAMALVCRTALIDITERKIAKRWKAEAERLRQMVEYLPAGAVYVAGEDILMNRVAEEITGFARNELQTLDQWFEALYGTRQQEIRRLYHAHREAGFPQQVTLTLNRKDGQPRVVEFAAHRFDDHEVWLLQDVTEHRELQRQVLEIAVEEDRRIGQELHDVTQQELTGLGLLAESLADTLDEQSVPEAELAGRLAQGIRKSAEHVHFLSRGLIPVEIDAEGLQAALAGLASSTARLLQMTLPWEILAPLGRPVVPEV